MTNVKTRWNVCSHLHQLVGSARELPVAELPTVRDLIRYGLYLREISDQDRRNYTNEQLVTDLMTGLLAQWSKANSKFTEPVINSKARIRAKLKAMWDQANKVSSNRAKVHERNQFMVKLEKLMDILTCKCDIKACSDLGCSSACVSGVHIACDCCRESKIPVIELAYIKGQREKVGSVGPHQMGPVDFPETKRQALQKEKLATRKEKEENRRKKSETRKVEMTEGPMSDMEEMEFEEWEDSREDSEQVDVCLDEHRVSADSTKRKRAKYNTKDISNVALASLRHHTGLRETAEIATAAWIDAGLISQNETDLVIDHNKVRRAQERVMQKLETNLDEELRENGISCIFFDGRRDQTKVMLRAEENNKMYPGIVKEEHYTVCKEPGGRYLWHFHPARSTETKTHAEIIADNLVDWLKERGADKTLQAIGGDSCNVNTGWEGGAMHFVEERLQRKLVWIVCDLHTGELPLRRLVTTLDGKTLSNNQWSGPIGKLLDSATELEINPDFTKVCVGPALPPLSDEVIHDLSTDQSYGYRIATAIRTGVLPKDLALLEIGPVSHSRWLTTALRFMRIWISKHNLDEKDVDNLRMIVEFCVGVYIVNWFNIKINSKWTQGPRHLLFQLQLLRDQSEHVKNIVMPSVRRSAWYGFSESVLQAMLCSQEAGERIDAVEKILNIRGTGDETTQVGDSSVRSRKTPAINSDATTLSQLIDWTSAVYEPPLTCSLTTSEVKAFVNCPMVVPDWPSHTQSVERCVKMTTEAAAHVYSYQRREQYIKGQMVSRELMGRNRSKQDMKNLVDFVNFD